MTYTKAQLNTEIRGLLNEPVAQFFSDTEIDEWIDQAALDISSKTLCYEASSGLILVNDTLEYTEPTGCLKVYACLYDNKGLTKIHPKQLGHITPTGVPTNFYNFAQKIGIYPVPGTSEDGDTVTVLSSLQTDDITDIPDEYQVYAILFALYKGKLKDGKFTQAGQLLTQYLNAIMFHRQDLYERGVDSKDMFKIPDRTVVKENA